MRYEIIEMKISSGTSEWCIGGDFNPVKNGDERSSVSYRSGKKEMEEFLDFIDKLDLEELSDIGSKFNWNIIRMEAGQHDILKHCPVWLKCDIIYWRLKPFRLIHGWFEHKEFRMFIEKEYGNFQVKGKKAFILKEKLKLLKVRLRWWNLEVYGWMDLQLEKVVQKINHLEDKWPKGIVTNYVEELKLQKMLSNSFWDLLLRRESFLRQKTIVKWIKEGDMNSIFFHKGMRAHNNKQNILHIDTDDGIIEGVLEIKDCINFFSEKSYKEVLVNKPLLLGIQFKQLSEKIILFWRNPFL